jgi:hypothetical protein
MFGVKPSLIGMVQGHEGDKKAILQLYTDPQGKQEIFHDEGDFNAGLARCVWIDQILALVEKLKNK